MDVRKSLIHRNRAHMAGAACRPGSCQERSRWARLTRWSRCRGCCGIPAQFTGWPVRPGGGPAAGGVRPERACPGGAGGAGRGKLAQQFTHPLALLLAVAAVLAWASGTPRLGAAIVVGDRAQRGVRIRPGDAGRAGRGGAGGVPARRMPGCSGTASGRRPRPGQLVPGDVLLVEEGDRVCGRAADDRHGRGGPVHADRRVGPGRPVRRRGRRPGAAAAGRRCRVQRHDLHRRRGQRFLRRRDDMLRGGARLAVPRRVHASRMVRLMVPP